MDKMTIMGKDGKAKYRIGPDNTIIELCWYCEDAGAIAYVGKDRRPICTDCSYKLVHLKDKEQDGKSTG